MSQTKISAMIAATLPLVGDELIEVTQGGNTRRAPASAFGAGEYVVLSTDFTAYNQNAVGAAPTDVVTFPVPINTLIGHRGLKIETAFSFGVTGVGNIGGWTIGVVLGGTLLASRLVPMIPPAATFFNGGVSKLEFTIQALNAAASQISEGVIHEAYDLTTAGTYDPIASFQFSAATENLYVSTINMALAQNLVIRVTPNGAGSVDKTLIHRYTKIIRIGA